MRMCAASRSEREPDELQNCWRLMKGYKHAGCWTRQWCWKMLRLLEGEEDGSAAATAAAAAAAAAVGWAAGRAGQQSIFSWPNSFLSIFLRICFSGHGQALWGIVAVPPGPGTCFPSMHNCAQPQARKRPHSTLRHLALHPGGAAEKGLYATMHKSGQPHGGFVTRPGGTGVRNRDGKK